MKFKDFLTFLGVEAMLFFLIIIVDVFHIGIKYMGEGLPMMMTFFLSSIIAFFIWIAYLRFRPFEIKKNMDDVLDDDLN